MKFIFLLASLVAVITALPQDSPERTAKLDGIRKQGQKQVAEASKNVDLKNLSLDEQKIKLSRFQIDFIKKTIAKKDTDFSEANRLRISSMITCILRNIFEITKERALLCPPEGAPKVENKRVVKDDVVLKVRDITTPLIENPPNSLKVARSSIFERNEKNYDQNTQMATKILDKAMKDLDEIVKLLGLDSNKLRAQ